MNSLRIQGAWQAHTTAPDPCLAGRDRCSLMFYFQVNAPLPQGTTILSHSTGLLNIYASGPNQITAQIWSDTQAVGQQFSVVPSHVYHLALSWGDPAVWYLDGRPIVSARSPGQTWNAPGPLIVGSKQAGADVQLQDLVEWPDYALTPADVVNLASRAVTPTNLATPATVWYQFSGAVGAPALAESDPGFGGKFAPASGTGSATYAEALAWTSPLAIADAHAGKSGRTLFLLAPQTSAIVTLPTLTVNGQPVALTEGPVADRFWSFSLATPVNPTDVLSVSAPAGWATAAPAISLSVTNNAGRCEFPIPRTPTMALGVNMPPQGLADGYDWCAPANWARRMRGWDGNTLARDAAGNPTKLNGTTSTTVLLTGRMISGLWTLAYDAPDGQTSLSLSSYLNNHVTPQPALSGTGIGGIGITKVYSCPDDGGLYLTVTHPAGTPSFSNLQVLPPANHPSPNPFALEAHICYNLTVDVDRGPSAIRWMDSCASYGGDSNIWDADDLINPLCQKWGLPARIVTVPLASLRPLDPAVSPHILTAEGTIPWPSPLGATLGYDAWVAEVVCAQPHGLGTGPYGTVTLGVPTLALQSGDTATIPATFFGRVWVTSPTTFALTGPWSNPAHACVVIRDAVPLQGASIAVNVQAGGGNLPVDFAAAVTKNWRGTGHWVNIPGYATDATVDAIAAKVLSNTTPGTRVIPEYSNEVWNGWTTWGYCLPMARMLGLGGTGEGFVARRSGEIAQRFRAAWSAAGRDPNDVVWLLAGQFGNMQGDLIDYALKWGQANGMEVGALSCALYHDLSWTNEVRDWSVAQCLDLMRHDIMLSPEYQGWMNDFKAARTTLEHAYGHPIAAFAYEGGLEQVGPISAWDWSHDPDVADTAKTLWAWAQANGFDLFMHFTLIDVPYGAGTHWGMYSWQDQSPGAGDGSDGRAVNQLTGQRVPTNVSPRGQAWREWQRAYWMAHP